MTNPQLEMLLDQADEAARNADWQGAADLLNQAVALQPDHVGAIAGMGTCALHLDQLPAAVSHFERLTELAPASPEAFNNLGVAYTLMGQWEAAETNYLKALELDTENFQAIKNLALVCLQQDDRLSEGVQILGGLYQISPDDEDVTFMLASCYEEIEDWDSAHEMYRQTLDIRPEHAQAKAGFERVSAKRDSLRIAKPEHTKSLAQLRALKNKRNGSTP